MSTRVKILICSITALAFILRGYAIDRYPPGIYWDEASSGYNGYSVLTTGRDEHGQFLPVYFKAFGEYKLPGLIYSMALSMAIFGVSNFALRFPSAFTGTLTVVAIFFLLRLVMPGKKTPLLASFFVATAPWHIHFSRAGFDATIALFFVTIGSWLWFLALQKQRLLYLFLAIMAFILSLYSYNAERVFTPLYLLALILLSFKKIMVFRKEQFILVLAASLLLCLPFISFVLSPAGMIRASSESFIHDVTLPSSASIVQKLLTYGQLLGSNYLSHFSLDYLFFTGDLAGRHSVREMGMLYLWQLLFLLAGFWLLISKRSPVKYVLLAWLFFGALPASLSRPSPHGLRSLIMIIPLCAIITIGVSWFIKKIPKVFAMPTLVLAISYGLFVYLHIYYIHYVKRTNSDWQDGYEKMVQAVKRHLSEFDRVIITKEIGYPYLYVLLYLPYSPREFLAEGGNAEHFGKFAFVKSPYSKKLPPRSLYVAAPWEKPTGSKLEDITMTNGDIAFTLWKN